MPAINTSLAVRILRIIQAIFAIIVLGTTAYVADWWTSRRGWHASTPSEVAFLIFVAVWTLLALVYLVLVPWRFSHTMAGHVFAITAVEGLTMLFWFAGFIALAVWLGDRPCYGNVCSSARAGAVFGAFEWLAFAITFGFAIWHIMGNRGSVNSNSEQPAMSVNHGT